MYTGHVFFYRIQHFKKITISKKSQSPHNTKFKNNYWSFYVKLIGQFNYKYWSV